MAWISRLFTGNDSSSSAISASAASGGGGGGYYPNNNNNLQQQQNDNFPFTFRFLDEPRRTLAYMKVKTVPGKQQRTPQCQDFSPFISSPGNPLYDFFQYLGMITPQGADPQLACLIGNFTPFDASLFAPLGTVLESFVLDQDQIVSQSQQQQQQQARIVQFDKLDKIFSFCATTTLSQQNRNDRVTLLIFNEENPQDVEMIDYSLLAITSLLMFQGKLEFLDAQDALDEVSNTFPGLIVPSKRQAASHKNILRCFRSLFQLPIFPNQNHCLKIDKICLQMTNPMPAVISGLRIIVASRGQMIIKSDSDWVASSQNSRELVLDFSAASSSKPLLLYGDSTIILYRIDEGSPQQLLRATFSTLFHSAKKSKSSSLAVNNNSNLSSSFTSSSSNHQVVVKISKSDMDFQPIFNKNEIPSSIFIPEALQVIASTGEKEQEASKEQLAYSSDILAKLEFASLKKEFESLAELEPDQANDVIKSANASPTRDRRGSVLSNGSFSTGSSGLSNNSFTAAAVAALNSAAAASNSVSFRLPLVSAAASPAASPNQTSLAVPAASTSTSQQNQQQQQQQQQRKGNGSNNNSNNDNNTESNNSNNNNMNPTQLLYVLLRREKDNNGLLGNALSELGHVLESKQQNHHIRNLVDTLGRPSLLCYLPASSSSSSSSSVSSSSRYQNQNASSNSVSISVTHPSASASSSSSATFQQPQHQQQPQKRLPMSMKPTPKEKWSEQKKSCQEVDCKVNIGFFDFSAGNCHGCGLYVCGACRGQNIELPTEESNYTLTAVGPVCPRCFARWTKFYENQLQQQQQQYFSPPSSSAAPQSSHSRSYSSEITSIPPSSARQLLSSPEQQQRQGISNNNNSSSNSIRRVSPVPPTLQKASNSINNTQQQQIQQQPQQQAKIKVCRRENFQDPGKATSCQFQDCHNKFGFFSGKGVNCFCCGIVVCSTCAATKTSLPPTYLDPVSVCPRCFSASEIIKKEAAKQKVSASVLFSSSSSSSSSSNNNNNNQRSSAAKEALQSMHYRDSSYSPQRDDEQQTTFVSPSSTAAVESAKRTTSAKRRRSDTPSSLPPTSTTSSQQQQQQQQQGAGGVQRTGSWIDIKKKQQQQQRTRSDTPPPKLQQQSAASETTSNNNNSNNNNNNQNDVIPTIPDPQKEEEEDHHHQQEHEHVEQIVEQKHVDPVSSEPEKQQKPQPQPKQEENPVPVTKPASSPSSSGGGMSSLMAEIAGRGAKQKQEQEASSSPTAEKQEKQEKQVATPASQPAPKVSPFFTSPAGGGGGGGMSSLMAEIAARGKKKESVNSEKPTSVSSSSVPASPTTPKPAAKVSPFGGGGGGGGGMASMMAELMKKKGVPGGGGGGGDSASTETKKPEEPPKQPAPEVLEAKEGEVEGGKAGKGNFGPNPPKIRFRPKELNSSKARKEEMPPFPEHWKSNQQPEEEEENEQQEETEQQELERRDKEQSQLPLVIPHPPIRFKPKELNSSKARPGDMPKFPSHWQRAIAGADPNSPNKGKLPKKNSSSSSSLASPLTSPNKSAASSSSKQEKQEEKPKLKQVFWKKLPAARLKKSGLWKAIDDVSSSSSSAVSSSPATNIEERVRALFEIKKKEEKKDENEKGGAGGGGEPKGKKSEAVPGQRAQNIGIALAKIKRSAGELKKAILSCNNQVLNDEDRDALIKILPTDEETRKLKAEKNNTKKEKYDWGDVENFLYAMATEVPDAKERLSLWNLAETLPRSIEQAESQLAWLDDACTGLTDPQEKTHQQLIRVFRVILQIGNCCNRGTSLAANGFTLESLQTFSNVKAADGKTSLFEVVLEQFDTERNNNNNNNKEKPQQGREEEDNNRGEEGSNQLLLTVDSLTFADDLASKLALAVSSSLSTTTTQISTIANSVQRLKKIAMSSQNKSQQQQQQRQEKSEDDDRLVELMTEAHSKFSGPAADLLVRLQETKESVSEVLEFLGEEKTADDAQVFSMILNFCRDFAKSRQTYQQKVLHQKRRKQQEEEAAAAKKKKLEAAAAAAASSSSEIAETTTSISSSSSLNLVGSNNRMLVNNNNNNNSYNKKEDEENEKQQQRESSCEVWDLKPSQNSSSSSCPSPPAGRRSDSSSPSGSGMLKSSPSALFTRFPAPRKAAAFSDSDDDS